MLSDLTAGCSSRVLFAGIVGSGCEPEEDGGVVRPAGAVGAVRWKLLRLLKSPGTSDTSLERFQGFRQGLFGVALAPTESSDVEVLTAPVRPMTASFPPGLDALLSKLSDEVCFGNVLWLLTHLHSKPGITPKGDVFLGVAAVAEVFFFRLFVFCVSWKASDFLNVFIYFFVNVIKRFFRTVRVV